MEKLITNKMVGLFLVTALTVSGCSTANALDDDECYDDDGDSYCDDDGGGAYGLHYINGRKVYYRSAFASDIDIDGKKKASSGISKGVTGSKGGIGGSTSSGG
ncbi:MAG TPA: hypothetical protein VEZ72_11235 [Paenibacillus sp.]|nr:hypothetical protein [Paenibacillus sp.]